MNRKGAWSDHVESPLVVAGPGNSGAQGRGPGDFRKCDPREPGKRGKGRSGPQRPDESCCVSQLWSLCAAASAPRHSVRSRVLLSLDCAGFLVFCQGRIQDTPRTLTLQFHESATPESITRLRWRRTVPPSIPLIPGERRERSLSNFL